MGDDYSIEFANGICAIRLLRDLELNRLIEVIKEVASLDTTGNRLWDVSGHFSYSRGEIEKIVQTGRKLWPTSARVAYVASDDLAFGLVRMLEVYREQDNYQTRAFRKFEDAWSWLEKSNLGKKDLI